MTRYESVHMYLWTAILLIHLCSAQDRRCYLEEGGARITFLANERLEIGDSIGVLPISGNPADDGDITLQLSKPLSPLKIEAGTKNLVLVEKLDKEGKNGVSVLSTDILCNRLGTNEPSFRIPVNIRITDDNDNTPEFLGAPYSLNVSELTMVRTVLSRDLIKAQDLDQTGPFNTISYSIIAGEHAGLVGFLSRLDNTLILKKRLDYEVLKQFIVTIRAQDQGNPPRFSDTTLTVYVIDGDDQNPRFLDQRYSAILPSNAARGTQLGVQPRSIAAVDQDKGINQPVFYTLDTHQREGSYFAIERTSGEVFIAKDIPDDEIRSPVTIAVKATQVDNPDRYAQTFLSISRGGVYSSELRFLQPAYGVAVLENVPINSAIIRVATNRPQSIGLQYSLQGPGTTSPTPVFRITEKGEVLVMTPLDYEVRQIYLIKVMVTDGIANDTAMLNVTVLNINDHEPIFSSNHYEFSIRSPSTRVIGQIKVKDKDRGDLVTMKLKGLFARAFSLSSKGVITLTKPNMINSTVVHLVVIAEDSGSRQSSVPVTISFSQEALKAAKKEQSFLLLVCMGVLLGLLIIIIVALTLYITKYKHKRREASAGKHIAHKVKSYVSNGIPHEKLNGELRASNVVSPGIRPTVPSSQQIDPTGPLSRGASGRTLSSAVSGSMIRGESSRRTGPSRSIAWPAASIPEKVKKLSWDDPPQTPAPPNRVELDADKSVTPLEPQPEGDSKMLTIYF